MAKYIHIATILLILLVSCSSKPKTEPARNQSDTNLPEVYQNDFFSIRYPATYLADANFSGKTYTLDELNEMGEEAMNKLEMNEVSIMPKHHNSYWISPEVYIVLSRHKVDLPLRMFMDLSIEKHNYANEEDMECLGYSDVDSISFAGHPALETNFYYLAENGDTLVQNQKIVMKPDFSLYYVNIKYNSRTSPETGEKIVSSFQFKD